MQKALDCVNHDKKVFIESYEKEKKKSQYIRRQLDRALRKSNVWKYTTNLILEEKAIIYKILEMVRPHLGVAYKNDEAFMIVFSTIMKKLKAESGNLLEDEDGN